MGAMLDFLHPDRADRPEVQHYRALLAQSQDARQQGNHRRAQLLASAAHQWAMQASARLQLLAYEQAMLARLTAQVEQALARFQGCATLAELLERHPGYRSLATAHTETAERVRALEEPVRPDELAVAAPELDAQHRRRAALAAPRRHLTGRPPAGV